MAKQKKANKDYEQLGKMLVSIYESGYIDHNQQYKTSFVKGLVGGLGGAIGATIIFGLLLWILSLFSNYPLLGRFIKNIQHTVETQQVK